jgi:hypothetical protein
MLEIKLNIFEFDSEFILTLFISDLLSKETELTFSMLETAIKNTTKKQVYLFNIYKLLKI